MHLNISFSEIPEQGLQLEIKDKAWFPEDQVESCGPVKADLFLARKGDGKIEVRGRLTSNVLLCCDRCLADFEYGIDTDFHLIYEVNDPEHHWRVQNMEGSEQDIETILLDSPQINIGDVLREQVFLALPEKKLCGQACKGLCPHCGADLNKEKCTCSKTTANSPFHVLAQLKKK